VRTGPSFVNSLNSYPLAVGKFVKFVFSEPFFRRFVKFVLSRPQTSASPLLQSYELNEFTKEGVAFASLTNLHCPGRALL
jgi:hypothetical protein